MARHLLCTAVHCHTRGSCPARQGKGLLLRACSLPKLLLHKSLLNFCEQGSTLPNLYCILMCPAKICQRSLRTHTSQCTKKARTYAHTHARVGGQGVCKQAPENRQVSRPWQGGWSWCGGHLVWQGRIASRYVRMRAQLGACCCLLVCIARQGRITRRCVQARSTEAKNHGWSCCCAPHAITALQRCFDAVHCHTRSHHTAVVF